MAPARNINIKRSLQWRNHNVHPAPIDGKCRFFEKLPAELRNKIYYYALVESEPIKIGFESTKVKEKEEPGTTEKWKCQFTMNAPLTMVNRQLRKETLGIYLEENTFYVAPLNIVDMPHAKFSDKTEAFVHSKKRLMAFQRWCRASAAHLKSIRVQMHDPSLSATPMSSIQLRFHHTSLSATPMRVTSPSPTAILDTQSRLFTEFTFTATQVNNNVTITDIETNVGEWGKDMACRRCEHRLTSLAADCDDVAGFMEKVSQACIEDPKFASYRLSRHCGEDCAGWVWSKPRSRW